MISVELRTRNLINKLNVKFPLNLQELADKINSEKPIIILDRPLPIEVSGMLLNRKDLENIYICNNDKETDERKRFDSLHELGHLFLGHQDYSDPNNDYEANTFAAELLLPYRPLRELTRSISNPIDFVHHCRKKFRASLEACCRRTIDLELFQGAFILQSSEGVHFIYKTPFADEITLDRLYDVIYENASKISTKITKCIPIPETEFTACIHKYTTGKTLLAVYKNRPDIEECSECVG